MSVDDPYSEFFALPTQSLWVWREHSSVRRSHKSAGWSSPVQCSAGGHAESAWVVATLHVSCTGRVASAGEELN